MSATAVVVGGDGAGWFSCVMAAVSVAVCVMVMVVYVAVGVVLTIC